MPKKERKVICPRCHRTIPRGHLAEHMRQHKGKLPRYMRTAHATKRSMTPLPRYVCGCGLRFETRQEAREHMKKCEQSALSIEGGGQVCSVCSTSSRILLPYDNLMVCPTCAIGFFESTMVFGSPLINHMGIEYEDMFREKLEVLLPRLGVEKLSELGIDAILITFSQGFDAFSHSHSPKGELIFIFARTNQIREMEKKIFENVINHEVFHAYIQHRLRLGITDKLKGPFTPLEGAAAQLAEDIQLEKIAVEDNVWPLIVDEINRTTTYYENMPPPISMNRWNGIPDIQKFLSMSSVTWAYAVESWFAKVLKQSNAMEQISRNLKLVYPHYSMHGYADLKDVILALFDERITKTEKESRTVFGRLLRVYDEYADGHNLILY